MIDNRTVAVVVPAYNEEGQIGIVLETMPDFVDRIVVVDDCSRDGTGEVVRARMAKEAPSPLGITPPVPENHTGRYSGAEAALRQIREREEQFFVPAAVEKGDRARDRIILITHRQNSGVGAAIATGYKWCRDHAIDCTAVMAGDGQMDPAELESICRPVIEDGIDYVKGNRLIHKSAFLVMPRVRFVGNSILSMLTKISSGYWHISDTQCGYTAISLRALNSLPLHRIYRGYGMPNDMLVKLNIAYCTIKEIGIKPVYRVGETSKMRIGRVIPRIGWLLVKSFFKRLWVKYFLRDFHPLFLLYNLGFLLFVLDIPVVVKMVHDLLGGRSITFQSLMVFVFLAISSFQSVLFAMWMDIQDNERLYR